MIATDCFDCNQFFPPRWIVYLFKSFPHLLLGWMDFIYPSEEHYTFSVSVGYQCKILIDLNIVRINFSIEPFFNMTRHGMTLDKSLTAVYLGSLGRCILITCDIHRPLWLVNVYGELKRLSGGTLCQTGRLSWSAASNSCRKNIGLSKLSPNSTLYRKVVERQDILYFWSICYLIDE
jgi:hypothetical protein